MGEGRQGLVVVGRIEGAYGIRGWVRVRSFTDPPANLAAYGPWRVRRAAGEAEVELLELRPHGKGFVAHLAGIADRDSAAELSGSEILVPRACLGPTSEGEYYWNDLLGLSVVTAGGQQLGQVDSMIETGANDVMVVTGERRRLIPFVSGSVVLSVDLDARVIEVDWDPEF